MKTVFITLLLFITSCTKLNNDTKSYFFVEAALRTEVVEYLKELEDAGIEVDYGNRFIVVLSNLNIDVKGAAGIAYGMNDDRGVFVRIDVKAWGSYNKNLRRWLIWHELGHDIFNLEHEEHRGAKIMFPSMPYDVTNYEWVKYKNEYINYLKSKQRWQLKDVS